MVHLDLTFPAQLPRALPLTSASTQEIINKILCKQMAVSVTKIEHNAEKRKRDAFDSDLKSEKKYHVI